MRVECHSAYPRAQVSLTLKRHVLTVAPRPCVENAKLKSLNSGTGAAASPLLLIWCLIASARRCMFIKRFAPNWLKADHPGSTIRSRPYMPLRTRSINHEAEETTNLLIVNHQFKNIPRGFDWNWLAGCNVWNICTLDTFLTGGAIMGSEIWQRRLVSVLSFNS